ncbi:MAG: hypothetical protein WC100_00975 [Sterolibacterium sp.]
MSFSCLTIGFVMIAAFPLAPTIFNVMKSKPAQQFPYKFDHVILQKRRDARHPSTVAMTGSARDHVSTRWARL